MKHQIPTEALDDRQAIVGTSGSGKTYAAMGLVERLLDSKSRVVIIDPLGVWWGLRSTADGKQASPYNIVIFGGNHGDLPLNEYSGAVIGETVAGMAESCIISLAGLPTKAAERRFMLAFLTTLYAKLSGAPLHLVFDEADMFAPEKILDRDGDAAKLLGQMETVVRRGRVKGFIPWLITQRPASLSKGVLSQADGLIAMKLTSSQDRAAIGLWIEGQADREQGKAILASLPTMQLGQGVVWLPGRDILQTVKFPIKKTFDSSRAPKRGEKRRTAKLKPVDIAGLREKLAKVVEEAKANDPTALKAELATAKVKIRTLEQRTAKPVATAPAKPVVDRAALEAANAKGWKSGFAAGWQTGMRSTAVICREAFQGLMAKMADQPLPPAPVPKGISSSTWKEIEAESLAASMKLFTRSQKTQKQPVDLHHRPGRTITVTAGTLPRGEHVVLTVIAQQGDKGADRSMITVMTGYKRSTRDKFLQHLAARGAIEQSGDMIVATPTGIELLGPDYTPLPTGRDLIDWWLARLPQGEAKILEALLATADGTLARPAIDEATGYKRSTRDKFIQHLQARRIVESRGGMVAIAIPVE